MSKLLNKLAKNYGYGLENYSQEQKEDFFKMVKMLNDLGYVELESMKKIVNILLKASREERDELDDELEF